MTNNPKVIGAFEAVQRHQGYPRIVRADFGTENGYIRDFQTFLRRDGRDNQSGRCYIEGSSTANQRMEAWWGFLRKECVQFWQDHFKALRDRGDFSGDALDKGIVQFCFKSLLQDELDMISEVWNNYPIRPSRNHRVPSGRPSHMLHVPGFWGADDQLCSLFEEDVLSCKTECEFRSVMPCDVNVYDACIQVTQRHGLELPTNVADSTELYLLLRSELRQ